MMYNNKLVCSVKVGKRILRETIQNNEAAVFIPFGSEYSLILKNLAGRNAVVHIQIDGKEVSENGFYMTAGKEATIEGFVKNFKADRKFKFIEKTEEISNFRGDRVDDGMVRVTWQFEKELPEVREVNIKYNHHHHYGCNCFSCQPFYWYGSNVTYSPLPFIGLASGTSRLTVGRGTSSACYTSSIGSAVNSSNSSSPSFGEENFTKCSSNDAGITVEGSKSSQTFGTAYARQLEDTVHSMVIVLKGRTTAGAQEKVIKPVTVQQKKRCPSCGRKYKGNAEFCLKDGTALK